MAKKKDAPPADASDEQLVQVQLTTGMAGDRFSYAPGQLLFVTPATRDRWFERGIARDPVEQTREIARFVEHATPGQSQPESVAGKQTPDDPEVGNDDDDSGELDP